MSNRRHLDGDGTRRAEERGDRRVHPLLFVVALLLGVAGMLWFVASHSSGGGATAAPAGQPMPAEPAK